MSIGLSTPPDQPTTSALADDESDQRVDDAGADSFPASDPPSWWAGTTTSDAP